MDQRGFRGEEGVEQVGVAQAVPLGDLAHEVRVGTERRGGRREGKAFGQHRGGEGQDLVVTAFVLNFQPHEMADAFCRTHAYLSVPEVVHEACPHRNTIW